MTQSPKALSAMKAPFTLERFKQHGVGGVKVVYAGGGDSGQIDSVTFLDTQGEELIPPSVKAFRDWLGGFEERVWEAAIPNDGWWNNDGGQGVVQLDLVTGEMETEHENFDTEHGEEVVSQHQVKWRAQDQAALIALQLLGVTSLYARVEIRDGGLSDLDLDEVNGRPVVYRPDGPLTETEEKAQAVWDKQLKSQLLGVYSKAAKAYLGPNPEWEAGDGSLEVKLPSGVVTVELQGFNNTSHKSHEVNIVPTTLFSPEGEEEK